MVGNGGKVKFHVSSHGQVIVLATQGYLVDQYIWHVSKENRRCNQVWNCWESFRLICFLHILTYTITWLLTHVCWLNYLLYLSWEHVRCLNIWTHSLRWCIDFLCGVWLCLMFWSHFIVVSLISLLITEHLAHLYLFLFLPPTQHDLFATTSVGLRLSRFSRFGTKCLISVLI